MGISDITSRPLEGVGISKSAPGGDSAAVRTRRRDSRVRTGDARDFEGDNRERKKTKKFFFSFARQTLNLAEDDGVCVRCFLSSISQPVEQPSSIPNRHTLTHDLFSRDNTLPYPSDFATVFCGSCEGDICISERFS